MKHLYLCSLELAKPQQTSTKSQQHYHSVLYHSSLSIILHRNHNMNIFVTTSQQKQRKDQHLYQQHQQESEQNTWVMTCL